MNIINIIMDYEKKYKEAFERARENYHAGCLVPALLEYIFPELKESEDEKVRKELIGAVQDLWDDDALPLSVKRKNEWLAWLEKQGEQKPNPYSGVSFEYNGHTWGMCARDNGVDIGYDKQFIAHINPIQEKDEFNSFNKAISPEAIDCKFDMNEQEPKQQLWDEYTIELTDCDNGIFCKVHDFNPDAKDAFLVFKREEQEQMFGKFLMDSIRAKMECDICCKVRIDIKITTIKD